MSFYNYNKGIGKFINGYFVFFLLLTIILGVVTVGYLFYNVYKIENINKQVEKLEQYEQENIENLEKIAQLEKDISNLSQDILSLKEKLNTLEYKTSVEEYSENAEQNTDNVDENKVIKGLKYKIYLPPELVKSNINYVEFSKVSKYLIKDADKTYTKYIVSFENTDYIDMSSLHDSGKFLKHVYWSTKENTLYIFEDIDTRDAYYDEIHGISALGWFIIILICVFLAFLLVAFFSTI